MTRRSGQDGQARFGNWIRLRILLTHLAIGGGLAGVGLVASDPRLRLMLLALAVTPLGIGLFLTYLYWAFADHGGGVQRRLWDLVLSALPWDGRGQALDIGTGQGALATGLAVRFPAARVIGIDLWAADWAYSKAACERNAWALGVADRVRFDRASAAALPFDDGAFDAVVSHFVFHEVRDGGGPRAALAEAIRVLRPGGVLAVQDMFLDRRLYGRIEDLLDSLRAQGLAEVHFSRLSDRMRLPFGMGGRRVLGAAGLITGVRAPERPRV